jgi:hypothetical protein
LPTYNEKTLNKKSIAKSDAVILEMLDQHDKSGMHGDIIVPERFRTNSELITCKISSIGPDAEHLKLKKGDVVVIDRWSCFGMPPVKRGLHVITRCENIILKRIEK